MSGSNAIAAAKRRRGGTEIGKPIQPQNRNQPQTNSNVPPSQIHPLQLVMINHERLNKISNEFTQFPQALDSLGENFNALSSNCDFLHEKIEGLESKLNTLNLSNQDASSKSVNVELNNQLASRLEPLEVRVNDLFKQFATLQSYMLELTLAVNNCKNSIGDMNSQLQEQKQTIHNVLESSSLHANVNQEVNVVSQPQPHSNFDSVTNVVEDHDTLSYNEESQSINYII